MNSLLVLSLPIEIWLLIAGLSETFELSSLCRTNSQLFELCLPLLSRHINVSTYGKDHHSVIVAESSRTSTDRSGADNKFSCLQLRQKCFFATMADQPQYHDYIQSITWSFLLPHPDIVRDDEGDWIYIGSLQQIWRALKRLISTMHIDNFNIVFSSKYIHRGKDPGGLHTAPGSLALNGEMSRSFAEYALQSVDPPRLVHLCLDRIQGTGFMKDDLEERSPTKVQHLLYRVSLQSRGVINAHSAHLTVAAQLFGRYLYGSRPR